MYTTNQLPTQPVDVPLYTGTGALESIDAPNAWVPDQSVTYNFAELVLGEEEVAFDPGQLTAEERSLAQSATQGTMIGIIAVPFAVVKAASDRNDSKAYVVIDGGKYALSLMFNDFHGSMSDPAVVGVYTGNPDITAL